MHFQASNHNFQQDTKFTHMDETTKATLGEQLQLILKKQGHLEYKGKNTSSRQP